MADSPQISFVDQPAPQADTLVVLTDESLRFGRLAARAVEPAKELIARAAKAEGFKGIRREGTRLFGEPWAGSTATS